MEQKIEQLLMKGLNLLIEMKERFLKEWKHISQHLNPTLVSKFDSLIEMALRHVSKQESPSIDSLILSLLNEWQNRFSSLHDEFESIFLISSIEDLFHKLLAENPAATILDHQAIQSFFSRILDHSLLTHDSIDRTEKWLDMILTTNVLPMKWIAVVKKEQSDFTIGRVVCSAEYPVEKHLLEICATLKASEINHLANAISRLLISRSEETPVIQIPCINETLLIGVYGQSLEGMEQQIDFIRGLYLRQLKLHHLENKLEWKDASLLFLQRLLSSRGVDGAVQAITKGLIDYMPFQRCTLFLYNHYEEKGMGVSGYNVDHSSVQQIREVIFKLPFMTKYLHSLKPSQPLYFSNAKDVLPEKYVQELHLKSLVVLPILVPTENKLLGIALLDKGEDSQFDISTQTMTTLIKFGHYAGDLLYSIWDDALLQYGSTNCVLTFREKEVLKLIAEGASINEAAQELHLSSYTVRDYVSAIIQKLAAKNRTDAAVKAIKMKLIS